MKITVINQTTDAAAMTKKYISALYGCSMIEFARQIEREKKAHQNTSDLTDKKVAWL